MKVYAFIREFSIGEDRGKADNDAWPSHKDHQTRSNIMKALCSSTRPDFRLALRTERARRDQPWNPGSPPSQVLYPRGSCELESPFSFRKAYMGSQATDEFR